MRLLMPWVVSHSRVPMVRSAAVAVASLLLLSHAAGGEGIPPEPVKDALPFSQSYTITGNYVVGGVDLSTQSHANGFVTAYPPLWVPR